MRILIDTQFDLRLPLVADPSGKRGDQRYEENLDTLLRLGDLRTTYHILASISEH